MTNPSKDSSRIAGRFSLRMLVKEANGIATYSAVDERDGTQAFVKLMPLASLSPAEHMRLVQQAAVLSTLDSPYVARCHGAGQEADYCWLAMPAAAGESLQAVLQRGPLPLPDVLEVGRCLALALTAVHAQGILHRDVKPANIIIQDSPRAVLIDFGFALRVGDHTSARTAVGTPFYVAPEQAGLLDSGIDERSDLYALGIVLYEAVTGRVPYQGASINEILIQHLAMEAPPLVRKDGPVPRALDHIIRRLLAKDPRDRYQRAASVVDDVSALATALASGVSDPSLVIGGSDERRVLTEPAFVGRDSELDTLVAGLAEAKQGRGGLILLEAASGGGKTRLMTELARVATPAGHWVLRGQGLDQVANRPFEVLAGVLAGAQLAASDTPGLTAAIAHQVGDKLAALIASLPAAAWLKGADTEVNIHAPEAFGEVRAMQAGAAFLDALGTAERPAVVLLDDCQWADELSMRLLGEWVRSQRKRYVTVVAAFRSDEVGLGHPLRRLRSQRHIILRRLGHDDLRKLAESMAGAVPEAALATTLELADGSPFMASAVLLGLVESGALVASASGWQVDAEALATAQSSRRAAAFLTRRLRLLAPRALTLLTVGAVLGKEFSLVMAAELSGMSAGEAMAAVAEARRRQIVWEEPSDGRWRFLHDKLREALLAELSSEQKRQWHARAAAWLKTHAPERIFALAFHYDQAGEHELALPYALEAAEQARSRHALSVAEQQYRTAARGAAQAEADIRARIEHGLGAVLMLAGRYSEAETHLLEAKSLAQSSALRVTIETDLGDLAFKRGDMHVASVALEKALVLLGVPAPRSKVGKGAGLVWEGLVQVAHCLGLKRRPRRAPSWSEGVTMRIYSRLAYAYWFKSGKVPCGWAHLRNLNLAERFLPSLELAQAYSEHGPVMTMLPWFSRAQRYAERSIMLRRERRDTWGEGQSLHFLGVVLYGATKFRECIARCTEAVRLLERTGDQWEVNTARWHIAYSHYRLGNLATAQQLAQELYRDAVEIGDHSSAGIALSVWAKASHGEVPATLVHAELSRHCDDLHTRSELLQAEALRLLASGSAAAASALLREAQAKVHQAGMRQEYVAPISAWLVTTVRRELEAVSPYAEDKRARCLAEARSLARQAVRLARSYRNNLPHALREQALLAMLAGKTAAARRYLDESLAEAEKQGAAFERAETLAASAHLAEATGAEGAATLRADAELAQRPFRAALPPSAPQPTLATLDRFDTLLDVGPAIVAAISRDRVFETLRVAASRLLRSPNCLILKTTVTDGQMTLSVAAGDPALTYSRSLVESAIHAAKPVAIADDTTGGPSDSLLLAGVRSALCAPVLLRGRVVACFHVTSDRVGRLFGKDDLNLATFIAALAGAAVENAEGFAQLQLLNDSLETQVVERRRIAEELEDARRQAEAANNAKSVFLTNISHEIRTPLASILGYAEQMDSDGLAEPDRQRFLAVIRRNGEQLLALVNDLLDLSKIEAGKLIIEQVPLRLADELKDVVHLLQPQAEQRGLELSLEITPDAPLVIVTDALRLRQIMLNIIGNALKFTAEGSVRVKVARRLDRGAGVAISVSDTGIGLSREHADRLFQPFEQAEASTTRRYGGTGLGLALTHKLVQALAGELQLEQSTLGKGSTFTVWLPATDAAADLAVAPKVKERRPLTKARPLLGMRLLLVEDALDSQALIKRILTSSGAEVEVANNGREGLEKALKAAFDLVLLDIQMPQMDGTEALERLRQTGYDTPIIMLTAHGLSEERDRCLQLGCSGYLTKPISASLLIETVERHVLSRKPARATI